MSHLSSQYPSGSAPQTYCIDSSAQAVLFIFSSVDTAEVMAATMAVQLGANVVSFMNFARFDFRECFQDFSSFTTLPTIVSVHSGSLFGALAINSASALVFTASETPPELLTFVR